MKITTAATITAVAILISGCATPTETITQELTIRTNPSDASCILKIHGKKTYEVYPTPKTIIIESSPFNTVVECRKQGRGAGTTVIVPNSITMSDMWAPKGYKIIYEYPPLVHIDLPQQ